MNESDLKLLDLQSALAEVQRLREENVRLRRILQDHGIQLPVVHSPNGIPVATSALPSPHTLVLKPEQRIALFRSLFHGRDDVYAVRWENAEGRSGYMPKADRDWKAYLRARDEERKKVDRQTRKFRPLTDEVVRGHLVGDQTIGIYPLLQDETCWFLAVDFDKKTWQKDAIAFLAVCRELSVPAALEISRSGNGGHVWIFFDRSIPATTARKLGCVILTRAMESRHQLGLDSYDRFFPNQDTMPKGGLGNLIALPLQKLPRAHGKSIFQRAFGQRRNMAKRNSRPAVLHLPRLKGEPGTNLPSLSKARLKELIEQAIVDAHGEEEQAGGFFTMIEEHLALPFPVKVLGVDADVEKVDTTLDGQIVAICRRGKTRQKIPILDLPLPTPAPAGVEWIVAYRHWRRGSW